jgi:hypothetical protein
MRQTREMQGVMKEGATLIRGRVVRVRQLHGTRHTAPNRAMNDAPVTPAELFEQRYIWDASLHTKGCDIS